MKLFQYWDTGSPPPDVVPLIEAARECNPGFRHRLYDRGSAGWFIRKHLGERHLQAFEACAVPAMQADYFRLCALVARGGVYLDCDLRCVASLADLFARAPHAFMLFWDGHIENSCIMVRSAGNAFLSAALELATDNIENRRFQDLPPYVAVPACTGPDVLNALWLLIEPDAPPDGMLGRQWEAPEITQVAQAKVTLAPKVLHDFHALTLMHTLAVSAWIETPQPHYKRSRRHWIRWPGSIYLDGGDAAPPAAETE